MAQRTGAEKMIGEETMAYRTVDLDRLLSMCRERVLAYHKLKSLSDCYGKCYALVREEFKRCIKLLLDLDEPLRMTCSSRVFITPAGQCLREPNLQRGLLYDMPDVLEYEDGIFVCYVERG
jgi:hypothetical protein